MGTHPANHAVPLYDVVREYGTTMTKMFRGWINVGNGDYGLRQSRNAARGVAANEVPIHGDGLQPTDGCGQWRLTREVHWAGRQRTITSTTTRCSRLGAASMEPRG